MQIGRDVDGEQGGADGAPVDFAKAAGAKVVVGFAKVVQAQVNNWVEGVGLFDFAAAELEFAVGKGDAAAHCSDLRVAFGPQQKFFKPTGFGNFVIVEDDEPFTAGVFEGLASALRWAEVGVAVDDFDLGELAIDAVFEEVDRFAGGAVVVENDFVRNLYGLLQALQGLQGLGVLAVGQHDDGDGPRVVATSDGVAQSRFVLDLRGECDLFAFLRFGDLLGVQAVAVKEVGYVHKAAAGVMKCDAHEHFVVLGRVKPGVKQAYFGECVPANDFEVRGIHGTQVFGKVVGARQAHEVDAVDFCAVFVDVDAPRVQVDGVSFPVLHTGSDGFGGQQVIAV